jgi:nicotinate phosphoribosyltransferase
MPTQAPLPPLVTSALGLGLEAFVMVRAAVAAGIADARASFELTVAPSADDWGFLVLAGVEPLIDALERLRPRADELDWLVSIGVLDTATRRRMLDARFACDVDTAPEGSVVFSGEAFLTVEGPFWQAQLVGGLVQAALTEATAVATRFARMRLASGGARVVEDGAATAYRLGGTPLLARAAFIGGAMATTSALAARRHGIPAMALQPARLDLAAGDFERAVRGWLAVAPGDCVVRIEPARAAKDLQRLAAAVRARASASRHGWDPGKVIVELPGGDRIGLARAAAHAFMAAELAPPRLLVSGDDVDERLALELRAELAHETLFALRGAGPRSGDHAPHPHLRARYDLVAFESGGTWSPRLRVGEDVGSSSDPGRKLLVRYVDAAGHPVADVAHATNERFLRAQTGRYVERATGLNARLDAASGAPLRASAMRAGKRATAPEPASTCRERAAKAVRGLDEGHRRITSPARYPVGMSQSLAALKAEMLAKVE